MIGLPSLFKPNPSRSSIGGLNTCAMTRFCPPPIHDLQSVLGSMFSTSYVLNLVSCFDSGKTTTPLEQF